MGISIKTSGNRFFTADKLSTFKDYESEWTSEVWCKKSWDLLLFDFLELFFIFEELLAISLRIANFN